MSDIGVFYKCFKESEAIEYSLEKLYQVYPDCQVYLASDGGHDYSSLMTKHKNLRCERFHDNRGWMLSPTGIKDVSDNFGSERIQTKLKTTFYEILERLNSGVQWCDKPYMLFMEPDVLVRGALTKHIGHDLSGVVPQPNIEPDAGWRDLLKNIDGAEDVYSWSWPVIFSKEAFDKCYAFAHKEKDLIDKLLLSDCRFGIADDVWLPILFACCGYKQVHNSEITECNRNPNWRFSPHSLLHEHREKYPVQGSQNVGRHSR